MTPRTRGLIIIGTILLVAGAVASQLPGVSGAVPTFGLEEHEHVRKTLKAHGWTEPTSIELRDDGFVVIDYQVDDTVAASQRRAFAEERLLAIREELLVDGFKNFRLNVNGPPPGTGLVRRYGFARVVEFGALEWVTP